jgi:hypothetical protein
MFGTPQSTQALVKQNSHRAPDEKAQRLLRELRQQFLDISVAIDDLLPPSRERSLAITKLDEARMWACNAATMDGVIREDLTVTHPSEI